MLSLQIVFIGILLVAAIVVAVLFFRKSESSSCGSSVSSTDSFSSSWTEKSRKRNAPACNAEDCVIYLSQCDFDEHHTYTIKNSNAVYKFSCSGIWDPSANATNAIEIDGTVENVDIDLEDFTLKQCDASTKADNHAILVHAGARNISIHDGTIDGFSATPIKILGDANEVLVEDINFIGCFPAARLDKEWKLAAVWAEGTANAHAANVMTRNCNIRNFVVPAGPSFVLQCATLYEYAENVKDENVTGTYLENRSYGQPDPQTNVDDSNLVPFGYYYTENASNVRCTAADNTSVARNAGNVVVGDIIPIQFVNAKNNYAEKFKALRNIGSRRTGGIVWLGGCTDSFAWKCVADSNTVLDPNDPAVQSHFAFEFVGGFSPAFPVPMRALVKDCHAFNQPGQFITFGNDMMFEDCTATAGDVSTLISPSANFGFEAIGVLGGGNGVTFDNCKATGFANDATQGGFNIALFASNVKILNSLSTKNACGITIDPTCANVSTYNNDVSFNSAFGINDLNAVPVHLHAKNRAWQNGTNYSAGVGSVLVATPTTLPTSVGMQNVSVV